MTLGTDRTYDNCELCMQFRLEALMLNGVIRRKRPTLLPVDPCDGDLLETIWAPCSG